MRQQRGSSAYNSNTAVRQCALVVPTASASACTTACIYAHTRLRACMHPHVHVTALCLCATTQKQWPRAQPRMDGWAAYMIPAPPSRLANSASKASQHRTETQLSVRVEPGSGQGWGAFENAGKGAASRHRTNTGAVSGHPNYLIDARHYDGGGDQVRFV